MKVNYLHMIWDVKIYLAKIKDGKGKDFSCFNNKKLPTKIPPNQGEKPFFDYRHHTSLSQILAHEMEAGNSRVFPFFPSRPRRHSHAFEPDHRSSFYPGIRFKSPFLNIHGTGYRLDQCHAKIGAGGQQ